MRLLFLRIIVAGFTLAISFTSAYAIEIKEVTSPGGIKAWLVENKAIPLIAMNFSFEGGSTSDPAGKEGTAHFLTGMMDEGAGDLDVGARRQQQGQDKQREHPQSKPPPKASCAQERGSCLRPTGASSQPQGPLGGGSKPAAGRR